MGSFTICAALAFAVFAMFPSPVLAAVDTTDTDKDGLSDVWELAIGTNPNHPDTDGDGHKDGTEVMHSYDPLDAKPVKREKIIRVDDKKLRLTFEFNGKTLMDIPVSTGKRLTPTPKGEFKVLAKVPIKHYKGATWDYPNTLWNIHFTNKYGFRYYIHGAYWHDKFGATAVSGGCVNVRYEDIETLYNWSQIGTKVVIT